MIIQKLKKNEEFRNVFKVGIRKSGRYLLLYSTPKEEGENRIGFIVKKTVGNAVQRNRIKRILREVWRNKCNHLIYGYDIIVMAKKTILQAHFEEIQIEFEKLIQESKRFNTNGRIELDE